MFSGTSFRTTALAPILEFFPITTGPSICAPDPTITLSLIVGCLLMFLWESESTEGESPPNVVC